MNADAVAALRERFERLAAEYELRATQREASPSWEFAAEDIRAVLEAAPLPSDTPADGLDAAWREAEAALPNDLDIRLTRRAAGGYTVELVTPEFRDGAFIRGEATPVEAFRAALALTQEPRSGDDR